MFESLGQYKILDRIGAGGMGEVFRARDTRLGRTVAVKVIGPAIAGDPVRRERFIEEARKATVLSHPNIAALYEVGEDQGQLFLVFEFVPGENLKTMIGGRPLNPRRAIDVAVHVADALADAEAGGILHRDLTSANIIVTPKGNAKVLDFGLSAWTTSGAERARAIGAAAAATTPGAVAYLSPEEALGQEPDHRSDIFSLGVVMFEMLTGRLPFAAPASAGLAQQNVQAPLASSLNRSSPAELDPIVARALAKSPAQRYESSVTLAAELRSVAAILDVRSDAAAPANPHLAIQQPRRSSGRGWIVLLLVVVAALLAAAWFQRDSLESLWRRTRGPAPGAAIALHRVERVTIPGLSPTWRR
jgi:serine/threonine protein kinase